MIHEGHFAEATIHYCLAAHQQNEENPSSDPQVLQDYYDAMSHLVTALRTVGEDELHSSIKASFEKEQWIEALVLLAEAKASGLVLTNNEVTSSFSLLMLTCLTIHLFLFVIIDATCFVRDSIQRFEKSSILCCLDCLQKQFSCCRCSFIFILSVILICVICWWILVFKSFY